MSIVSITVYVKCTETNGKTELDVIALQDCIFPGQRTCDGELKDDDHLPSFARYHVIKTESLLKSAG